MSEPSHRPGPRPKLIISVVVLALIIAGSLIFFRTPESPDLGTVHGIVLQSFDGESEVALASLAGRPMVLNWWASWCTFCIAEMPDFQSVYEEVSDEVEFVGVNLQDRPEVARRLADSTGVRYLLVTDPSGTAFATVDAVGMPTTLFVDARGRILERFTGPLTAEALRGRLTEHFGVASDGPGRPPA